MSDRVTVHINGKAVTVRNGTVVAAAIAEAGVATFRRSVLHEARGPLCGMGICMECRVSIDGRDHARSCQVLCVDGMKIQTDA